MSWVLLSLLLGQAPSPAQSAEAKRLFLEGATHFEAHRYERAAQLFEASFSQHPRPVSAFNRARCAELTGDVAAAVGWYRRYLQLAPTAGDRPATERALRKLGEQAAASGVQVLTVFAAADVTLKVDEGPALTGWLSVKLAPGAHTVFATAPGFSAASLPVDLPVDTSLELTVTLEALPPAPAVVEDTPRVDPPVAVVEPPSQTPPQGVVVTEFAPPPPPRSLKWTWVAGSVAAAGALTASTLGVVAVTTSDQLRGATPQDPSRVAQLTRDTRTFAAGADVAWVAAATALVTTVVIFFVEK